MTFQTAQDQQWSVKRQITLLQIQMNAALALVTPKLIADLHECYNTPYWSEATEHMQDDLEGLHGKSIGSELFSLLLRIHTYENQPT